MINTQIFTDFKINTTKKETYLFHWKLLVCWYHEQKNPSNEETHMTSSVLRMFSYTPWTPYTFLLWHSMFPILHKNKKQTNLIVPTTYCIQHTNFTDIVYSVSKVEHVFIMFYHFIPNTLMILAQKPWFLHIFWTNLHHQNSINTHH